MTAADREALLCRCAVSARLPNHSSPRASERGQTTAEYALVIIGAAAVALLLLAWATDTGTIAGLLDKVVGSVADMVN